MQPSGQEIALSSYISSSYTNFKDEEAPEPEKQHSFAERKTLDPSYFSPEKTRSSRFIGKSLAFWWRNNRPLCTIGPHWYLLLPSWIYLELGGAIFYYAIISEKSDFLRFLALGLIIWQGFIYMLVALKNPGIVLATEENNPNLHKLEANQRLCLKCNIIRDNKTVHCSICNVCVKGYDHHCPWTGKCIGSGNIYSFYVFLVSTAIYFTFFILFTLSCVSGSS